MDGSRSLEIIHHAINSVIMVQIPLKDFVSKNSIAVIAASNDIPDLRPYSGRAVVMYNDSPIDIRGIVINSWSKWYFPLISFNDFVGYVVYPDATHFWIIGHTIDGYFAHQVY